MRCLSMSRSFLLHNMICCSRSNAPHLPRTMCANTMRPSRSLHINAPAVYAALFDCVPALSQDRTAFSIIAKSQNGMVFIRSIGN